MTDLIKVWNVCDLADMMGDMYSDEEAAIFKDYLIDMDILKWDIYSGTGEMAEMSENRWEELVEKALES